MAEQVRVHMSAAEFFQLPESNTPAELLDGVLMMSPAPIPQHQRASNRVERLVESLMPDGEMFHAPIDLYFDDHNVVQPDVVWVAANSRCQVTAQRLEGPPELIVEIFSPGTERQDRKKKFELYERFGVAEYWMLDPLETYIEVHALEAGRYQRVGVFEPGDEFVSPILGGQVVEVKRFFA